MRPARCKDRRLYVLFAQLQLRLVHQVTDARRIVVLANHEYLALLRHEEAVEPLYDGHHVARYAHKVVLTARKHHVRPADDGIPVAVPGLGHMKLGPAADVGPAKVATLHENVLHSLQYAQIKRQVGCGRVIPVAPLFFLLRTEAGLLHHLEQATRGRREQFEMGQKRLHVPQEQTRVPQELSAVDEHLREMQVGLLRKRLDVGIADVLVLLAHLDVAIARVGRSGRNAQGKETFVRTDESQAALYVADKTVLMNDVLVDGRDPKLPWAPSTTVPVRPRYATSRLRATARAPNPRSRQK